MKTDLKTIHSHHVNVFFFGYNHHCSKSMRSLNTDSLVVLQASNEPRPVTAVFNCVFVTKCGARSDFWGDVMLALLYRVMYHIHQSATSNKKYSIQGLSFYILPILLHSLTIKSVFGDHFVYVEFVEVEAVIS